MKKTKLEDNCNILQEQIKEHTNFNRARIFVIVGLIISISKLRVVNLKKLATVLNPRESKTANYRRIGRFLVPSKKVWVIINLNVPKFAIN